MKSRKEVLSMLLAGCMTLSLAACGGNGNSNTNTDANNSNTSDTNTNDTGTDSNTGDTNTDDTNTDGTGTDDTSAEDEELAAMLAAHTESSKKAYDESLSDFYNIYSEAKTELLDLGQRYAKMAISEAKLLESGVMLPTTRNGGNYALSRVAPRTISGIQWGYDSDRYHSIVVVEGDLINREDRTEMTQKWAEMQGTGGYLDWVKQYLTDNGYTLKDSYDLVSASDPQTWDVLSTSKQADAEFIVQTFSGLVEYDCENVMQPALAESWEASEDGLTYTFHLRDGVKWVDSQGREVADVKADDFVAGMQHALDTKGGLEFLVKGVIVGATEYDSGEEPDFSKVGVKALDDLTLQYTLVQPCPYFMSMLPYGIFSPMSRTYYESQGGKFGDQFDNSAADYTYGTTPNNIAYCGPFLVTNATEKNIITYKYNESYWDPDSVNVHAINFKYNDGSEATKSYNDMMAGDLDGAGLVSAALEQAKKDGVFEDNYYVSATDATSFMIFHNINRATYVNTNDGKSVPSAKTDEQKTATEAAMKNVHFRMALNHAIDRGAWYAQQVGEDLKYTSMCNAYTPGNFVQLPEETTVDINGTPTTFPAGTNFGEIVQAQLDADGSAIKAYDPTVEDGIGSSDTFDGWYNPDAAKAELAKAVEELAAAGVTISAENPIHVELPVLVSSETRMNMNNALKQSVESVLEGQVVIDLTECKVQDEWYYTSYWNDYGYQMNYDISELSGWGPDYGDPSSYLDTFLPNFEGYMTKSIGIF